MENIRIGILGLGNIAQRFVKTLPYVEGAKLHSVCSRSKEKGELWAKEQDCLAYTDYEAFLKDPDLDLVYIALPHKFHYSYAYKALMRGKNVFCEKPAVLTVEEWDVLTKLAKEKSLFLMEAYKTPFCKALDSLKEFLSSLGEIRTLYANFCTNADANTSRTDSYLYDPGQGGALWDVGPYPLNYIFDLLGEDYDSFTVESKKDVQGIDHHDVVTFKYGNTKAVMEVAIDETKPKESWIETTNAKIHIPDYHRPYGFSVTYLDTTAKDYSIPLEGDDMSGELREAIACITNGALQSARYGWQKTRKEIETLCKIKAAD